VLQQLFSLGGDALMIRTGIHHGECIAGNMGTLTRVNYTVIGDPVNTAARLEAVKYTSTPRRTPFVPMGEGDEGGSMGRRKSNDCRTVMPQVMP